MLGSALHYRMHAQMHGMLHVKRKHSTSMLLQSKTEICKQFVDEFFMNSETSTSTSKVQFNRCKSKIIEIIYKTPIIKSIKSKCKLFSIAE